MPSAILRIRNSILVAFLIWFLLSASKTLALDVQTAFDHKFPLSRLKSFSFVSQKRMPPDALAANPATENRIRENLESQFSAIGMQKASIEPDFVFAFYAKSVLRTRWQSPSYGGPGSSGNTAPMGYEVGTQVVDIVDPKSSQVVWRGIATKALGSSRGKGNQVVLETCLKLAQTIQKRRG